MAKTGDIISEYGIEYFVINEYYDRYVVFPKWEEKAKSIMKMSHCIVETGKHMTATEWFGK